MNSAANTTQSAIHRSETSRPALTRQRTSWPRAVALSVLVAVAILLIQFTAIVSAQVVSVKQRERIAGTIESISPGELQIKTLGGDVIDYKIQDESDRAVSVQGQAFNFPAKINFTGKIPARVVDRGLIVQFQAKCNVNGKSFGRVNDIQLASVDSEKKLKVDFLERPKDNSSPGRVHVVGRVISCSSNQLHLSVAAARWAKQGRIKFEIADDASLHVQKDSLELVVPGDTVTQGQAIVLTSGDRIIERINISPTGKRLSLTQTVEGQIENQFLSLSDQPSVPRELRSAHFVLFTDLSDRSANVLLAKLESVFASLQAYYRNAPNQPITCYVADDLTKWNEGRLSAEAKLRIRAGLGVTEKTGLSQPAAATVYSCADHEIVQHEAVHAFCIQTFGSVGPTWYAEGIAEMGRNWNRKTRAVSIDPVEIAYLKNSPYKPLAELVARDQATGDSWQAYAQRWALCHLLANNTNYKRRFKSLGKSLMTGTEATFESSFERDMPKIDFEYRQMIQNLTNGYRVDLCAWNWKTVANKLSPNQMQERTIKARRGWQATKLAGESGMAYQYAAKGQWKTSATTVSDADGNRAGQGRLVGAWFSNFKLSEPFELGARGRFIASQDGQLLVRCRDDWGSLADNEGEIQLFLRISK